MVEDIASNAEASRKGEATEGGAGDAAEGGAGDAARNKWTCSIFVDDDNDRRIVEDVLQYGGERTLHHAFDQMLKRRWTAWKATSGQAAV
jgi:hypothetical protein